MRRKPHLRLERVQECLRRLRHYSGQITGDPSLATSQAVHRLIEQRDLGLYRTLGPPTRKGWDVNQPNVQAHLQLACRPVLATIDQERMAQPEDRCGTAANYSNSRRACVCIARHERIAGICLPKVSLRPAVMTAAAVPTPVVVQAPVSQAGAAPATIGSAVPGAPPAGPQTPTPPPMTVEVKPVTCLPTELKAVLQKRGGPRPALPVCELPCLAPPEGISTGDLSQYEQQAGMTWCTACVPFSAYLPLEDIEAIERAGRLSLCRQAPRSAVTLEAAGRPDGARALKGARALFTRRQSAVPHGNVAVIVTMQRYQNGLSGPAHARRDGAAMRALLIERLGYQNDNVIEVKDPTLSELVRVFGQTGSAADGSAQEVPATGGPTDEPAVKPRSSNPKGPNPRGEIAGRLDGRVPSATLLVYVAGLGAFRAADPGAFLLPVDVERGREEASGYPLGRLIDNLVRAGAQSTTLLLEVDFNRNSGSFVLAPNLPEAGDRLPAGEARGNIAVLTAADRDQRTLEDPEFGIGLFTRHLITGLSGAADMPPIGNGDFSIDALELHVHTAYRVELAARRSFGVTQKPTLLRGHGFPVARLSEIVN